MQEHVSESLQIVGEELATTLNDVRVALEQYVDGDSDARSMDRCLNLLHSAKGALRVTETFGASLLAEEMEGTCVHVGKQRRGDMASDEAIEALSRAAVQLPAYVDRVLNGGRDIPLVLLPLLNDLRAARGKPLLSESTLLLLNSGIDTGLEPKVEGRQISGLDIMEVCAEQRPRFQLALLGWIKNDDVTENLTRIAEVSQQLELAATTTEVFQLWWVVGGVVESLLEKGLETSVSLKRLMGQADREMKRLVTVGEAKFAESPPTELLNNLLYYVARSTSRGRQVTAIRTAFSLSDLLPADDQVEALRESLAAPSPKLMNTVAQAIRDDLSRVKDVLDIYVRTGMEHAEELIPQIELLKKIGDTIGVLGLGEQREIIRVRREELQRIVDSGEPVEEAVLVELAAALLEVEDGLEDRLIGLVTPSTDASDAPAPTPEENDYEEVQQAVMRECIVNLGRVKDAVTQVLEHPGDTESLDAVPQNLRGMTAGLLILEKEAAVAVVEGIEETISALIADGSSQGDAQKLDLLADAIVSLEYYLETLRAGRREPQYMLDNAERCLEAARAAQRPAIPDVGDMHISGSATTMQIAEPAPDATLAAVDTKRISRVPVITANEERFDPEILELFIEEAREEIESIGQQFPAWADDFSQEDAMLSVRRSFHTLKGSGRMVGAELIGEYCWNIEDLMNRLINGSIDRTPGVVAFLGRAIDALPELLEQLEVGDEPKTDIEGLMRQAIALGRGEAIEPETAGDAGAEAQPSPPLMEPELFDVFSKEVATHLGAIQTFVSASEAGAAPYQVTEELYRACHTLHGSVTMADVAPAAEVTLLLNEAIRHAYDHGVFLDEIVIDVLHEFIAAVETIVSCLDVDGDEFPDTAQLQEQLRLIGEDIEAAALEAETPEADESATTEEVAAGVDEPEVVDEAEVDEEPEAGAAHEVFAAADDGEPVEAADFDPEIAGIFSDEAAEILESADATLARLDAAAIDETSLAEMQRYLHTLKGGARMAGLAGMGNLSHEVETVLDRVSLEDLDWSATVFTLLQASIDELHRLRDQAQAGVAAEPTDSLMDDLAAARRGELDSAASFDEVAPEPVVEDELEAEALDDERVDDAVSDADLEPVDDSVDEVAAAETEAAEDESVDEDDELPPLPAVEQIGQLARELEGPPRPEARDLSELLSQVPPEPGAGERRDIARVDRMLLETLLNNAGEISIFHSRLSQQLSNIQFNLDELGQTVIRLRDQLRNLEMATEAQILYHHQSEVTKDEDFDPLELDRYSRIQHLSRALAETASDVNSLKDLLQSITGDTEMLLVQQARTTTELQDGLMRTRMVPVDRHAARLARLVRQIAAECDKRAELTMRGGGEIDRQVLEKMLPPFEHMLRNAVIHGIEAPEAREAAGKPAIGNVSITLLREGSEILIEIADDGRGHGH